MQAPAVYRRHRFQRPQLVDSQQVPYSRLIPIPLYG